MVVLTHEERFDVPALAGALASDAFYVGASVCYTCHGRQHEKFTLHVNGIRAIGKSGSSSSEAEAEGSWVKVIINSSCAYVRKAGRAEQ